MNGILLCFQKILLKKTIFNKKVRLKIDSAAFTGNHGKYNEYDSFLWPPLVAAHDHKKHARVLLSGGSFWLCEKYPYTQDSVMFIIFYLSLPTAHTTISDEITFAETVGKVQR